MRRREFITLLGGAAAWPLALRAQQPPSVRRIAWMGVGRPDTPSLYVHSLRAGLRDLGWIEGRNLTIDLSTFTVRSRAMLIASTLRQSY
jgi:putative ABC transport system substrate-binding protein